MTKEFDRAVRTARKALRDKDKDAYLKALLDVETLIETLSLGEREIVEEQDLIFSAVGEGLFRDVEHLSENLVEVRKRNDSLKDYRRTFKTLKNNLDDAFESGDQDSFFQYLFEFEDLLGEHGLPEILRSEGMKYWDKTTKKVDDAGWLGKKEIVKREARPSKWEKREADIKKMVTEGVTEKEAIRFVDARILSREKLAICPVCGSVIDLKKNTYVTYEGERYHKSCFDKFIAYKKEFEDKPFLLMGTEVYCGYCKQQIMESQSRRPKCPKGVVDVFNSLECVWFHADDKKPFNCYDEQDKRDNKK